MAKSKPSFSGDVTLSHSQTSVEDLVSRLVDPETEKIDDEQSPLLIPSLQREFCWDTEDIERLFDSLLRGLPIGTLLMWEAATDEEADDEAKYKFIRHYANHSNFPSDDAETSVNHHSSKLNSTEEFGKYTFTLDGQQRLTSFLIGLKGSFYEHRYRKHTDNIDSYYQKNLCINLLENPSREPDDAQEHIFDFEFRREERQGHYPESKEYWWSIKNIWNQEDEKISEEVSTPTEELDENGRNNAEENLSRLQEAMTAEQIPYEEVKGMRSEEALELFIRRNKGGEDLNNSDIAFSLITVYWKKFDEDEDPKDLFESKATDFTEEFGDHNFGFGKSFLIRALLYLNDERPAFERDNLVPRTIEPLERYWGDQFFKTVRMTFNLVTEEFGLTNKCIGGKTSLLPILYYCYEGIEEGILNDYTDIPEKDQKRMEYWIELTVLNNIFNVSSSMSVLDNVRPMVRDGESMPIPDIVESYQGGSTTIGIVADEEKTGVTVSGLVNDTDHSSETTIRDYLLTKLYDDRGVGKDFEIDDEDVTSIEVDHFFPASKLRNNEDYLDNQDFSVGEEELEQMKSFCSNNVNRFGNFTLLPHGSGNQSKGEKDPEDWLDNIDDDEVDETIASHHLPDIDSYSYENYEDFLELREEKLIDALESELVLADDV